MAEAVLTDALGAESSKKGGVLGGSVIVGGTAIGAGMFALPVSTSGMWFGYSLLMMIAVWYCMYSAGLYLLEANLRFPLGASFDSMAQKTFGKSGRIINNIAVGFVLYIITYAYVSGGSSIVSVTLASSTGISVSQPVASLIFAVVLSAIVMLGAKAVDRMSVILVGAMVLMFVSFSTGIISNVDSANLFPALPFTEAMPFSFSALVIITVSFGFQNAVPSLTKYMHKDHRSIKKSILFGSLLALAFYSAWLLGIFGNLSREQFPAIIADGGNVGTLVSALQGTGLSLNIATALQLFSNMALATSFLGVTLSLYDYISDMCGFSSDFMGRAKTAALTFLPPTLLGIALPDGFISAIGYAGLGLITFCVVSPVIMAIRGRTTENEKTDVYRVPGGKVRLYFTLGFGLFALGLAILDAFALLPKFGM